MRRSTFRMILTALMFLGCTGIGAVRAEEPENTPWLGVYLANEVDGGIRIVAVVPGSPASQAGLRKGDLLLEAADEPLADQAALERILVARPAGRELAFGILRDGRSISLSVVPVIAPVASVPLAAPRPRAAPVMPSAPTASWPGFAGGIGLDVVEITEELRRHYGARTDRGLLVVNVEAGGGADRAGIRVGDVLVEAGEAALSRRAEFNLALLRWDARRSLPISLIRKRHPLALEIPARKTPAFAGAATRNAWSSREARSRHLELTIESLERRLEALRKELAAIEATPPEPTANPER